MTTLSTEELMNEVRRLRIRTRRRVDSLFAGEYHSAFKGQGIEFAEVREYAAGDDIRSIDWNVTARVGKPFIKRFIEERQLTVVYMFDASGSGVFGSVGRSKARLMAEVGAAISLTAQTNSDRTALMRFSDDIDLYVPPSKGMKHVLRMMRELLSTDPKGSGTAFPLALERINRLLPHRSVIFVASDWTLPNTEAIPTRVEIGLKMLARRHDVIAVRASDPLESEIPPAGLIRLRDPETGRTVLFDSGSRRARQKLRSLAERSRAESTGLLRRCGIDLIDVSTDRPFVHELMRYFRMRERRR